MKDKTTFVNAKKNIKYQIKECSCDDRLQLFGIRKNSTFTIIEECPFGGTVIINCNNQNFCVRRNEIDALLEEEK